MQLTPSLLSFLCHVVRFLPNEMRWFDWLQIVFNVLVIIICSIQLAVLVKERRERKKQK